MVKITYLPYRFERHCGKIIIKIYCPKCKREGNLVKKQQKFVIRHKDKSCIFGRMSRYYKILKSIYILKGNISYIDILSSETKSNKTNLLYCEKYKRYIYTYECKRQYMNCKFYVSNGGSCFGVK